MAEESGGSKKPPRGTKATAKAPGRRASAATGKSTKAARAGGGSTAASARKPAGKSPAKSAKTASASGAKQARPAAKPRKVTAAKATAGRSGAGKSAAGGSIAAKSAAGRSTAAKPARAPAAEAESSADSTRAVVESTARRYFAALADRDPGAAAKVWDPNGVDDVVPLGIYRGPDAIRAFFDEMFAAMPDARFSVERVVADDESAAVQWRAAGTFTGEPFQGIEATGRRVDLRGIDCLEIVDGKIVHNTGVFDGAAFARQIGLLPPEDSGADRAMRAGFNTVTKLRRSVARRGAG